ncbi:hypothetical protein AAZX31_15G132300 [Glycine max]|uniref:Uncharacterized protein n=2 Tax=Glycine subgen. Soja TaxID=1462606 RepID=K7MB91_SOYBN|nr:hypothetical protein GYH30_042301 [Glycine max]KAH1209019.1 hypothetical protein GmHk_15G043646 [Glycine max]KRH11905.1 hypothetical protein GLYMA_15G138300v4 [Glycine max]RZB64522.1 hypothetical protein D0Y65_040851 [Glycine soja]
MSWRWWYTSSFRWPELHLTVPWPVFRWPALDFSYLNPSWNVESVIQWNLSLVDDILWALVTGLESIALLAMLCYFFLCCGCTL